MSSIPRCSPLTALTLTFTLACSGSSGQETETDSASGSGVANSTNSTGSTGGGTDTGGFDREICDRYIACIAATVPTGLPAAQQAYGPDSTCWTLDQMAIDLCLMACETGLSQGHVVNPGAPECYVCRDDTECNTSAGEVCYKGGCTLGPCGDGIVQSNELCDGALYCADDCQGGTRCSPLTDVGCDEDEYCGMSYSRGAQCFKKPRDCTENPEDTCPSGMFCNYDNDANFLGCLPYCDLNAPMPCPDGLKCVPWANGTGQMLDNDDALSYLGECLPP